VSVKPTEGIWAPVDAVPTPQEAAEELSWGGPAEPRGWSPVIRQFRDGHTETWWAAELVYGPYGPQRSVRRVVATTAPVQLPAGSTWYVETNLPAPRSKPARQSPMAAADIEEVVRLYGLRGWVEQSYKQIKHELGWADAMVRSDKALRRHWLLVFCAFAFCWFHWLRDAPTQAPGEPERESAAQAEEKKGGSAFDCVAGSLAASSWLVGPMDDAPAMVAGMGPGTTTARVPNTARLGRRRAFPKFVSHPRLTNYRYGEFQMTEA
jgi:hypothetical protein